MMRPIRSLMLACVVVTVALPSIAPRPARAATAAELSRDSAAALNKLYARQRSAKILGERAKGILVFPAMVKAGFMFGGQIGEGALRKRGKVAGYYNSVAASYGFQAGVQKFGYALFFMTDAALDQLDATNGFEIGVGPSLVIVDEGMGKSITSNTITSDVYAFIFDQSGLMAGAGIQGSKITRINK
jgi:lipid-binding SYLF domain-containing protein